MMPKGPSADDDLVVDVPIPEGWVWTRVSALGQLGEEAVKTGPFGAILKSKEFVSSGVPILAVGNVQSGQLNLEEAKVDHVTEKKAADLSDYRVRAGDVLFTRSGTIGRSAVVPWSAEGWLMSYHLLRVRGDQRLSNPQYLYFVFSGCETSRRYTNESVIGTTRPGINTQILEDLPVPLPPLAEQQRIVTKCDELRSDVNSARDHLSRVPAILKRFRQAVLAAACSGRLTADWREKNMLPTDTASTDLIDPTATSDQLPEDIELPREWKVSTLDKFLTRVEAGKNIRCLEHPPGVGKKGIVKISAVTWGDFREDESKTLEDPMLFMPERAIRAGDLLISRANTIDLVGACVLVGKVKRTLMLSDKVLRLQAADKWKPWLLVCLRSRLGRFQIEGLATGNQLSMRNITQDSLRRIVIPLPSPRERDEAVRRVEQLLGLADAIEKRLVVAASRCNSLTQSILAKAFRGELVPTEAELARREGREYEPASVLLERIKKERESQPSGKRERKAVRPKAHLATAKGQAV